MKLITPRSVLIEKVAMELAMTWYEIGRNQGLTSKWPTAKAYGKANLVRFIPNATSILIDMLKPDSNCSNEMREEIYEAFMERHDDPELQKTLPNIDVKKVIAMLDEAEKKKVVTINTEPKQSTVLDNIVKPQPATRH